MRILRIKVNGLPLYKNQFDISFCAIQRVQNNHLNSVYNLFGNIYVNTVEAFAGINASGKTMALKVILFAGCLLDAMPLNKIDNSQILGNDINTLFDIDFCADEKIFHLSSEIIKSKKQDETFVIRIVSEKLWSKTVTSKVNKTNLLDFEGLEPVRVRNNSDEYLPDDVSIMTAVKKQISKEIMIADLTGLTDRNWLLPDDGFVRNEIVSLLDPTIEYIKTKTINDKKIIKLKFYGQGEVVLSNYSELTAYLSSGTVRGVTVFSFAVAILKKGGYLIIDEVENHFNRELVASLLRLFTDKRTNPNGAVVIFSTHYSELLDRIERNDSVFITRSEHGLTVDNLNHLLKRNDMKKSEVYQSNCLGGTAPKYKSLDALQKSIINPELFTA